MKKRSGIELKSNLFFQDFDNELHDLKFREIPWFIHGQFNDPNKALNLILDNHISKTIQSIRPLIILLLFVLFNL